MKLKLKKENDLLYSVYKCRWYWTNKRVGEIFKSSTNPQWHGVLRVKGLPKRTQTVEEISETVEFYPNKDPHKILSKMNLIVR